MVERMTDSERIDEIEEAVALMAFRMQGWRGVPLDRLEPMQKRFEELLQSIVFRATARLDGRAPAGPPQPPRSDATVIGTITDL